MRESEYQIFPDLCFPICLDIFWPIFGGRISHAPTRPRLFVQPADASAQLRWQRVRRITRYELEYKVRGTPGAYRKATLPDPLQTALTITGLTNNSEYAFRVRAVNRHGASEWRTFLATPTIPPPDVTNLAAIGGNRRVQLSWDNQGPDLTYLVKAAGLPDHVVPAGGNPSTQPRIDYLLETPDNTSYTFSVVAVNEHTVRSDTPATITVTTDPNNRLAPTNLTLTLSYLTPTQMVWAWDAVPHTSHYEYRYKLATNNDPTAWTEWVDLGDTRTVTLTDLIQGFLYDFEVSGAGFNMMNQLARGAVRSRREFLSPDLPPPQNLSVSESTTATDVVLNFQWDAVANASGYTVFVDDGDVANRRVYALGNVISTNPVTLDFTDPSGQTNSLVRGNTYRFFVRADRRSNVEWADSPLSDPDSERIDRLFPNAPQNVRLTALTGHTLSFAWDTLPDATGYEVRHRESGGTWEISSSTLTATNYRLTGLDAGTEYDFEVRGIGTDYVPSEWSSTVTDHPRHNVPAPQDFDITQTRTHLNVQWTAVTEATDGYLIEYKEESSSTWLTYRRLPPHASIGSVISFAALAFLNIVITRGTTYNFRIQGAGNGTTYRNLGNPTSTADEYINQFFNPTTVQNFTAHPSDDQVRLTWNLMPDAARYRISRSLTSATADFTELTVINSPSTLEYTDTGLMARDEHWYRIEAEASGFWSSDPVTIKAITSLHLPAPENFAVTQSLNTQTIPAVHEFHFSWDAVSDATGYEIFGSADETTWTRLADIADGLIGTTILSKSAAQVAGQDYHFRIRAKGDGIEYQATNNTFTDNLDITVFSQFVSPPSNFRLEGDDIGTTVTLNWDAAVLPAGSSASISYDILRGTDLNGPFTRISYYPANRRQHTYTNTGLTANQDFVYLIESRATNFFPADSGATLSFRSVPRFPVPSNIALNDVEPHRLIFQYQSESPVPNGQNSQLQWRIGSMGEWSPLVDVAPHSRTGTRNNYLHTISDLTPNTAYQVRIRIASDNSTGRESDWSTPFDATTEPQIAQVVGISTTNLTDEGIDASWTSPQHATHFLIETRQRQADGTYNDTWTSTQRFTGASYSLRGLDPSTTYQFRVIASGDRTNFADSEPSAPEEFTTKPDLDTPVLRSVDARFDRYQAQLIWDTVPNASSYQAEYKIGTDTVYTIVSSGYESFTELGQPERIRITLTGLNEDTEYNFRVRAIGDAGVNYGDSQPSNIITATTRDFFPKDITVATTAITQPPSLVHFYSLARSHDGQSNVRLFRVSAKFIQLVPGGNGSVTSGSVSLEPTDIQSPATQIILSGTDGFASIPQVFWDRMQPTPSNRTQFAVMQIDEVYDQIGDAHLLANPKPILGYVSAVPGNTPTEVKFGTQFSGDWWYQPRFGYSFSPPPGFDSTDSRHELEADRGDLTRSSSSRGNLNAAFVIVGKREVVNDDAKLQFGDGNVWPRIGIRTDETDNFEAIYRQRGETMLEVDISDSDASENLLTFFHQYEGVISATQSQKGARLVVRALGLGNTTDHVDSRDEVSNHTMVGLRVLGIDFSITEFFILTHNNTDQQAGDAQAALAEYVAQMEGLG